MDYHLAEGERLNEAITRSWNRLATLWVHFQDAVAKLPEQDLRTTLTRERWLLPLFQELGYGRLQTTRALEVKGKTFPISHGWGHTPIHLVGSRVDLDSKRAGVAGAARSSPHSLVQELLNTSDAHLWGSVSNGLKLRILRDNASLVRQAYVEFDLEAIFSGQVYADFVVLWLLCHQSRVESDKPEGCWLERCSKAAHEQGSRALEDLRNGVEQAITALGSGFLRHPANQVLKDKLRLGHLTTQDYYRQLLRLIYRLLFLFVAEDRDLLLRPDATEEAKERYHRHYSTDRLRRLAGDMRGTRHTDLFQALRLVMSKVGCDTGCVELGLPALGGFLFSKDALTDLDGCELSNHDLLQAMRALAFLQRDHSLRRVDYKNLRSEELGSVYEALLELHPRINADAATFELATAGGHERKQTGSYYTPDSLVLCLLDSALDPVVEEACRQPIPEHAIMKLKICDPACGSGHFLIAAAHRIAKRLASIRTGDEEPAPEAMQHALRDAIGHCVYGVDQNPMAVELCKVALWMEAVEPGKPLSFLDHHIRVGNSLIGATPQLIAGGLPDEAFTAIEGDDRKVCAALKKQNKQEREGQQDMLHQMVAEPEAEYNSIAARFRSIDEAPDDTLEQIQGKAEEFHRLVVSPKYNHAQLVADAWCAAFVWHKHADAPAEPVTTNTIRRLEADPNAITPSQRAEVKRLSGQYQFFHWHQAFPEVFAKGGFDCVLGNPPWERVKIQEKEWFAERSPEIANAPNAAARKRLIDALKAGEPVLHQRFLDDSRKAEGESHVMRDSGRYPLCGRGDINLYAIFAEVFATIVNDLGRSGSLLPCGIATDDTTKNFFQYVVDSRRLYALFGFINEEMLFPSVLHNFKFCLLILGGNQSRTDHATVVFNSYNVEQSKDEARRFALTREDVALLNPNTRTCPVFFWKLSADITKAIYRRLPVLYREGGTNEWALKLGTMFHMSNDSGLFMTEPSSSPKPVPLYEAKMLDQYNHRYASYEHLRPGERSHMLPEVSVQQLLDPYYQPRPCYFVKARDVEAALPSGWSANWLLGFREITSAGLWRTTIYSVLPMCGASNKIPLVFLEPSCLALVASYLACMNSFVLDFVSRQKLGGASYSFFIKRQLPIPPPTTFSVTAAWERGITVDQWVRPRVLELTYTAWDLEPFAQDCGWSGPPFCWDEERRFLLRCELDAAFFHLYLPAEANGDWRLADGETAEDLARLKASFPTPRDAVAYIMDTFPIVKRKAEEKWGEYRTKRVILEIYDALAESIRTGRHYQTRLDPPPADPLVAHAPRETIVVGTRADVIPFRRIRPKPEEKYKTCVPLLSLKVAAGGFSDDQAVQFEDWVEIEASHTLRPGMFAAQVIGRSMEPLIPGSSFCLFRYPVSGIKQGMILLVQHRDIHDPETGGTYTVKRYERERILDENGVPRTKTVRLQAINPEYQPIVLQETEGSEIKAIAEFIEVLQAG